MKEKVKEALYPPEGSSEGLIEAFNFVHSNSNLITSYGGMQDIITGLDKHKLVFLAKEYEIDLTTYDYMLSLYEDKVLEDQRKKLDGKNNG